VACFVKVTHRLPWASPQPRCRTRPRSAPLHAPADGGLRLLLRPDRVAPRWPPRPSTPPRPAGSRRPRVRPRAPGLAAPLGLLSVMAVSLLLGALGLYAALARRAGLRSPAPTGTAATRGRDPPHAVHVANVVRASDCAARLPRAPPPRPPAARHRALTPSRTHTHSHVDDAVWTAFCCPRAPASNPGSGVPPLSARPDTHYVPLHSPHPLVLLGAQTHRAFITPVVRALRTRNP
jgi:hypothetical protein